jgi:hypothetical protein
VAWTSETLFLCGLGYRQCRFRPTWRRDLIAHTTFTLIATYSPENLVPLFAVPTTDLSPIRSYKGLQRVRGDPLGAGGWRLPLRFLYTFVVHHPISADDHERANAWTGNRTRAYRDCKTGDAGMTLWSARKMRRVADCLDGWARLNRDLARA